MSNPLPSNLRHLVNSFGSISEFCRAVTINRQQFNKYLNGRSLPSPRNLRRICDQVGISESDLFLPPAEFASLYRKPGRKEEASQLFSFVESAHRGHAVRGYPALLDDDDSVSPRVLTNPDLQQWVMRGGVRRLLLLTAARFAADRHESNRRALGPARGRARSVSEFFGDSAREQTSDACYRGEASMSRSFTSSIKIVLESADGSKTRTLKVPMEPFAITSATSRLGSAPCHLT